MKAIKNLLTGIILIAGISFCSPSKKNQPECVAKENPECVCTMQYDPVCGCDGKTYSNACLAGCAGVAVVSSGPCSDKSDSVQ